MHYGRHVIGKWTPGLKAFDYGGMYACFAYLVSLHWSAGIIGGSIGVVVTEREWLSDGNSQTVIIILGIVAGLLGMNWGGIPFITIAAVLAFIGAGIVRKYDHPAWHVMSAVGTTILRLAR